MTCKPRTLPELRDGFESDHLSGIWTDDKFIPGALSFMTGNARTGNQAARIILKPGDQIEKEKGTELERAELKEARRFYSIENSNYYYSFSLFLPPDFPIVPTRLVIAQWKQDCRLGNCDPGNPVIALRFVSGILYVTLQTGREQIILYHREDSVLNRWLDFKFLIRFSRNENGRIMAWLCGTPIVDYTGATAYSGAFGNPDKGKFYFKTGLYRDRMDRMMTIFIDGYLKRQVDEL